MKIQLFQVAILAALGLMSTTQAVGLQANDDSADTPKIVAQPTVSVNGKPAFALGNI